MRNETNAESQAEHNCTNPPHYPPHCGCPAGLTYGTGVTP